MNDSSHSGWGIGNNANREEEGSDVLTDIDERIVRQLDQLDIPTLTKSEIETIKAKIEILELQRT